uniref:Putative secreted protein n=1 Tax=Ixodes ricinus TaxID=34613 RepID=A0A6B0TXC6_IXORI
MEVKIFTFLQIAVPIALGAHSLQMEAGQHALEKTEHVDASMKAMKKLVSTLHNSLRLYIVRWHEVWVEVHGNKVKTFV